MRSKWQSLVGVTVFLSVFGGIHGGAAYLGSDNPYLLDSVIVEGTRKNQFGEVITEQSYYRTGGDVNVITSDDIAKKHYSQLSDALKYVPGVQVMSSGYRGGEYTYSQTHTILSMNGDTRVLVLVDGRRMDNSVANPVARSLSGSSSTVDVDQIISMNAIEKIEVIKGPGASIYGPDATGGVINIITKKGGTKSVGTVDISLGAWNRKNYKVSYSGGIDEGKLRYFLAFGREQGGNSKYKDGVTGKNYTYYQTGYTDDSANVRMDYAIDNHQMLSMNYNYMVADDDYPLSAPDYNHLNQTDWEKTLNGYNKEDKYGSVNNPGYRNLWILWQGAYSAYKKKNIDLSYRFGYDHGMESYVRFYNQDERYWGSWGAGDGVDWSPVPLTPEFWEWVKTKPHYAGRDKKSWLSEQKNKGVQVQWAKRIGKHDVVSTWTYDKSKAYRHNVRKKTRSSVERKSLLGYVQDKIHVTDNWEITPSLRYSHYSSVANLSAQGEASTAGGSVSVLTPSINTQYAFNDSSSVYFGYTRIYRPLRPGDYTQINKDGSFNTPANLQNEKGDVWTVGVRKEFGETTSLAVHYDYTNMSNAVARYSVWDKPSKEFKNKYVNAKHVKKAINLTLFQQLGTHWDLTFNYSHSMQEWKAKNGETFDPELSWTNGNVNNALNRFIPANTYTMTLTYNQGKWNSSLLGNYYTGCNTNAFTDKRFLVFDWSVNYEASDNLSLYGTVTNLTNEAYETTSSWYLGMGAWPQPGRAFLVGAKYNF